MNIRTRHMAILIYGGLAAIVLVNQTVTEPTHILGLLAPLGGMFAWDKIKHTEPKE